MDELIGVTELAQYLKVNPQTIYNWVSGNKVPYTKVGDLLRFKKEDIDGWLKKKTTYPDRIRYKNFEIEAIPYPIVGKKWTLSVSIWRHKGSESISRPFSGSNVYDSKNEAIKNCIDFGVQIIDGKIKDISVDDLKEKGEVVQYALNS